MNKKVKLSDLRGLAEAERARTLSELVSATRQPPNGEIVALNARLVAYEQEHGIKSEDLAEKLHAGLLRETPDVCEWLMLLSLRNRIGSPEARSS